MSGSPLRASHEDPDEPLDSQALCQSLTSAYRMQLKPRPAQSRLKFKEGLAVTTPPKIPLLQIPPRKLTHRLV